MSIVKIYNKRVGRPMPVLGEGATSTGLVQYTFGAECKRVETCSNATEVVTSDQFCLTGGPYYSASYRALQEKDKRGKVVYNSTITSKTSIYGDSEFQCEGGGNACSIISF